LRTKKIADDRIGVELTNALSLAVVFALPPARRSSTELPPLFFLPLVRGVERSERGQSPPLVTLREGLSESSPSEEEKLCLRLDIERSI
jgi:hypothetical protein